VSKHGGFNPTLVRLRPWDTKCSPSFRQLFQSHAGSIEALIEKGRRPIRIGFQSHAGSIEAPRLRPRNLIRQQFQSHAGSIEAFKGRIRSPESSEVSIPRWFD